MFDLAFKHGFVVNGEEIRRLNVYVQDGKIAEVSS